MDADGDPGSQHETSNEISGHVGTAVQARTIGVVNIHVPCVASSVPRQLPGRRDLINRVDELAAIDAAVAAVDGGTGPLIVLCGAGGVGKTALALWWLHGRRSDFPDGELWLDLGGGTGRFVHPRDALFALLRALEVASEVILPTQKQREAQYRSAVAGRRMVLFLENAVTAAQVMPLLPGDGGVFVVVTSRAQLTGLKVKARPVYVGVAPLAEDAAVLMLRQAIGATRLERETTATRRLVALCGRYPLAVSLAGARLAGRPHAPVAASVDELADRRTRLVRLVVPGEDVSMSRTFESTYANLPPRAAVMFRRVGLHPTPEFNLGVAAAAAGMDLREAEDVLTLLGEQLLVTEIGYRRYRVDDLLWTYAGNLAAQEDSTPTLRRIVEWYLRITVAADLAVTPRRWRVGPIFAEVGPDLARFPDPTAAMAWLESERVNLVAAVQLAARPDEAPRSHEATGRDSLDESIWQLVVALWGLFFASKDYESWIATHTVGIAATRRLGNRLAEAKLCCQRGFAYLGRGEVAAAIEDFTAGLAAAEAAGEAQAQSTAMESLGLAMLVAGDAQVQSTGRESSGLAAERFAEALDWFDRALAIAVPAGLDERTVGLLFHHRGRALSGVGRHVEALTVLAEALAVTRDIGDRYNEGRVLTSIGAARRRAGALDAAIGTLQSALAIMREESIFQTAVVAVLLADIAEHQGQVEQERAHLDEALTAYRKLKAPEAATIAARLARLDGPPTAGRLDAP